MENVYQSLKKIRAERRPEVIAEPAWRQGVMWSSPTFSKSPIEINTMGVMGWTRMAMATVITSGDALGWEKFINLLLEKQFPVSQKKALRLKEEFNIQGTTPADCVNTMVVWAKGDLFSWHVHPRISEKDLMGLGTWCPQCSAVEEMGMGNRAENLRLWCDFYDSTICRSLNTECRMVHAHCPSSGDRTCMFYIFEEEAPKNDSFYQVIKHFNDKKRKELEIDPDLDYFEGMAPPRFLESMSEVEKLHDGVLTKARIGLETMLIAAKAMGWENFLNLIDKEHAWGYHEEGMKLRRDYGIKGTSLRDAANLMTANYASLGFDNHCVIEYGPKKVEGVADRCMLIEAAKELNITNLEDVSLWCDYYHNHKVKPVNPDYQVCHTHCLGRGDKYCRFVLK